MHRASAYRRYVPKNKPLRAVLGENVAAAMKAKGLNQSAVEAKAKKAGTKIDQTTVGRVMRAGKPDATREEAKYPATVDSIEAIANGLGVQPFELFLPSGSEQNFLAILKAWAQSDAAGRKLLTLAARGALARDQAESENGRSENLDLSQPRRAGGD